jgi:hypothetical protein
MFSPLPSANGLGAVRGRAALVISILSLVVAGFALYETHLKPFRPEMRAGGRVRLAQLPPPLGARIELDLIFTNHGALRGVVEDVAVLLAGPEGFRFQTFESLWRRTDRTLNLRWQGSAPPPPRAETFVAFDLPPRTALTHAILFVPSGTSQDGPWELGEYQGQAWYRHSGSTSWQAGPIFSFTVDSHDIAVLSKVEIVTEHGRETASLAERDKKLADFRDPLDEFKQERP